MLGKTQPYYAGQSTLYGADLAVIVGFSLSDFDAMAMTQLAEVAKARWDERRPLPVIVINPYVDEKVESRFRRVFRFVHFEKKEHQDIDWVRLTK